MFKVSHQRRRRQTQMSLDFTCPGLVFLFLFITQFQTSPVFGQRSPPSNLPKEKIVVGYLPAVRGSIHGRQGISISGAVSLAIERINNRTDLLPGVELDLVWSDTEGDTIRGTKILTDMLCNDTAAFFGPEFSCAVEATVAAAWNRTMISYLCSDGSVSDKSRYPTFARTEAPDHQVVKSVLSLMAHYKWNIFQIIIQNSPTNRYVKVADSLYAEAEKIGMKPNDIKEFNFDKVENAYWFEIVNATKTTSRIYVFIGESENLVEMMGTMQSLKMFEEEEYLVIYIDMETYDKKEAFKYLWRINDFSMVPNCRNLTNFEDRTARSLLVVAPSPPNQTYESFSKDVITFTNKPPFNFRDSIILGPRFQKFVSIYAANLYDSVFLYAKALDSLWKKSNRTEDIQELARDGRAIFQSIIQMKAYDSITGARISIDANGDSEGNYTVFAYMEQHYESSHFTCDHGMFPVANFQPPAEGNASFPKIKFFPGRKIDWDQPPADSPKCGFQNENCAPSSTISRSMLTAAFLGLILLVVLVVAASLYRKWKIEQEIEGLLWKIDKDELQFQQLFGEHTQSRMSLVSVGSFGQVYCTTAHYKGAIVRVKELKLQKKHVISRQTMKEMRYMREMGHPNINKFCGAVIQPMEISLIYDYCGKGSLSDVVENEDLRLDNSFIASLIHDLIKGMIFLHESDVEVHGNLKSSNCVITSRWVLQLTDFGLAELQHAASLGSYDPTGIHTYYQNLLWKAPELLREKGPVPNMSQKGDAYAFAIILYEIYGRKGPYGPSDADPKEIVDRVRLGECPPYRPDLSFLDECPSQCPDYVVGLMTDCWDEYPENRPNFRTIREKLKPLKEGMSANIVDQMMVNMEKYTHNLEDIVSSRTAALEQEKRKTEDLLHRMLPMPVAQRLTMGDGIEPESFEMVTIYFSDIVGFTQMSAESTPFQVVNFLNDLYTLFDGIIRGYDVYKVETIGDAYMVVSGCPLRNADHAGQIASMALDLLEAIRSQRISHHPNETLKLRIGMHSGPVCAGVVGLTMPRYCLFGDTVNTASRMESNGEPLKIHISNECKEALDALGGYITEERGYVHLKGKGSVLTHWLLSSTESAIKPQIEELPDLKPLFSKPAQAAFNKHFQGVGGNLGDQASFRRKASPKVAGSVSVSRQGSFCAGQGGGNPLLTARNSTYYLRRPSFDPAMLSHSLRNSQTGSTATNIQNNGSSTAVNRNSSPSPNRRPLSKPPSSFPAMVVPRIPSSSHRKRSGSISAVSTCSDGDHRRNRRPVTTECCAVTIEPPSDSSNPASPDTSPVKTLAKVLSEQELKRESPGSPARKKIIGFLGRRKKASLGNGREFHSLDQIPDGSVLIDPSPLTAPILNKTRKLSRSLDIPDDLSGDAIKGGRAGRRETCSYYDNSNNKSRTAGHQYDDVSSLDERAEDSHLLGKSDKENLVEEDGDQIDQEDGHGDSDSYDEEDSGVTLTLEGGGEQDDRKSVPKPPKPKNWNGKRSSSGGATTVKKWFQNILNGNGMSVTSTGSSGTTPPAAVHNRVNPTIAHHFNPSDGDPNESEGKLLAVENKKPSGPTSCTITEHESVV